MNFLAHKIADRPNSLFIKTRATNMPEAICEERNYFG